MGFFRDKEDDPRAVEPTLPMPEIALPPRPQPPPAFAPFAYFFAPPPQQATSPPPAEPAKEPEPPKPWLRRIPWRYRIALMIPAVAGTGLALIVGGMLVHYTMVFPDPMSLRHKERAPVMRVLARDGSVLASAGRRMTTCRSTCCRSTSRMRWSPPRTGASSSTGASIPGVIRAAFANLRAGRFAQGGSTLTQQLAKNLFLAPERTSTRKVEELVLALWLEVRLSKRDILELYLNQVYFGGGAYGIETAAQRFFAKSARELTLAEAAMLAGLLKAPSKYSPGVQPGSRPRARPHACWPRWWRRACCRRGGREARVAPAVSRFADRGAQRDRPAPTTPSTPCSSGCRRWSRRRQAEIVVETTIDGESAAPRAGKSCDAPVERGRGPGCQARQPGSCSMDRTAASARWSAGAPTRKANSIAR